MVMKLKPRNSLHTTGSLKKTIRPSAITIISLTLTTESWSDKKMSNIETKVFFSV